MRKTSRQLERYFKGVANHHRLDILFLVGERSGLSLDEITQVLGGNLKTISEHTKKLVQAGLLYKSYKGRKVAHSLSPFGKQFCKFANLF